MSALRSTAWDFAGGDRAPLRGLSRDARLFLLAEACSAFAGGAFLAVYNLYVLALGYDPRLLGTLLAAGGAGAGLGALPAGALVDRLRPRAVLLAASLVAAAGIGAQLASGHAAALLIGNAVAGAGAAAYVVAAAPFLTEASAPGTRPRVFSVETAVALAFTAAGTAAGGQAAVLLEGSGQWAAHMGPGGPAGQAGAYWLTLAGASAIGACAFVPLVMTRGGAQRDSGLRMLDFGLGGRGPAAAAGGPGGEVPNPQAQIQNPGARASGRSRIANPNSAPRLAAVTGLIGAGAGLFIPYLNVFFVEVLGTSPAVFGWLSASGLLCRLAGTVAAPRLAARFGAVQAIAGTQLASVPLLLLLGFAPHPAAAAAMYLARGTLMNMAAPITAAFTMQALPPVGRGRGNSIIWLVGNAARTVSTLLGGALIAAAGYRVPYLVTAVCYVSSSVLLLAWFGGRRRLTAGG